MKRLSFIPYFVICVFLASCGPHTAVRSDEDTLQDQIIPTRETDIPDRDVAASAAGNARTVSKGRIESVTDIAVYSQMQEQIVRLNIKDGSIVRKGDIIVELNDENLMNQLVQARNAFEQAEHMYQEILVGQGYNIEEMDKVPENVSKISKVKSSYNTSETSLKQAERNYAKRNVKAPVSGIVTDVSVHQFDLPQSTAPLCRIFDPHNMKVVFNILENERGRIEIGSEVSVITVAYANEIHSATVNLISPRVDENGMIRIEAKLKDCNNLIPGMTAFVNL